MYECIETDEFEAIKRLGSKIIPFVMFKLAKDDGDRIVHGVFLCGFTPLSNITNRLAVNIQSHAKLTNQ